MLVLAGGKTLGAASLSMSFLFGRGVWLGVIRRRGLVLDTRFSPAPRKPSRAGTCFYFVERGCVEIHGGHRFEGPVALVFSEPHFQGTDGAREVTFRTEGEPLVAVEVHVTSDDAMVHAARPHAVELGDDGWARVRGLVDANDGGAESSRSEAAAARLVEVLVARGLVAPRVADQQRRPLPFERMIRAVRPLAERFALSATLDEVSLGGEASSRQLDRWFREFLRMVPLVGSTWRETTVLLRLKLATLFLSADGISVSEVARAVGYGSTDAMARAFRDARLPAPSAVRDSLRA